MFTPAQAELQELFRASQNLPNAYCEIGRIQLGLTDLTRVARAHTSHKQTDAKAHYLLAGSGFNAEQIIGEISTLEFETQNFVPATGVERYLTNKKQDSVYQSIAKLVSAATSKFDQKLNENISIDWPQARKRQVKEAWGTNSVPRAIRRQQRPGALILGDLEATDTTTLHKARDFATVISAALSGGPLASGLAQVACRWDAALYPQIIDTWTLVCALTRQRKFHDSLPSLDQVLETSRVALEEQYRSYVNEEINLRRKDAQLGGVPSPFNKIRAFVDLKYKNNAEIEQVNKTPIWAQLFFLVRCGYVKEAQQLVAERKDIFEFIETSFATYFTAWAQNGELTPAYQQLISSDYATLFRPGSAFDPFKQALYKIIGRCDLLHKSIAAAPTTEDWLWLQIRLVKANSEYTSEDLQLFIRKAGAANFEPSGTNPGKYFSLLVHVGLFEQAIEYLLPLDEVSAVHFAICLNYYGLVRVSNELTSSSPGPAVTEGRLNFAQILGRYTRFFRQEAPHSAVDYLCIDAQNRDINRVHQEWTFDALQELSLESKMFVDLFGDSLLMQTGYVESRTSVIGIDSRRQYLESLALPAAEKAYKDGRMTDAIILYHIGEDYNKVLSMSNSLVAQTITSTPLGQPIGRGEYIEESLFSSEHPVDLAENLMRAQEKHPLVLQSVDPAERQTAKQLLVVAQAMNAFARHEYQQCLALIDSTGFVPDGEQMDFGQTRELANRFAQYPPTVTQTFPQILEMSMVCCIEIVKLLEGSSPEVAERYRVRAGNCIAFVGLVQYQMPGQVYSRLTRLESELSCLA